MDRYHILRSAIASTRPVGVALLTCWLSGLLTPAVAHAHGPFRDHPPTYSPNDLIPSIGSNLPSYRERYNRPRYVGGKIAYHLSPTSQEAMSWHRSAHRGYYANHAPRMEDKYFYPKPWEVFTVGPRQPVKSQGVDFQGNRANDSSVTEEIPSPPGSRDNNRNHANDLPPALGTLPVPDP